MSELKSFDDTAAALEFRDPQPLPGGRSWTARMINWEPDRLGILEFEVTVVDAAGASTSVRVTTPDPADDWTGQPEGTRWVLARRIRDAFGIHQDEFPRA